MKILMLIYMAAIMAMANPFFIEDQVPKDSLFFERLRNTSQLINVTDQRVGIEVTRVDVKWLEKTDSFEVLETYFERSGTQALLERAKNFNKLGSFKGVLIDQVTGDHYYAAIGTGALFRKLSRGFSFRFPKIVNTSNFHLIAEDPISGEMKHILTKSIAVDSVKTSSAMKDIEVQLLQEATVMPKLIVNFYAEGYLKGRKKQFFSDSLKAISALKVAKLPMFDQLEFNAVFAASSEKIGGAVDLGKPVKGKNTFLGLYYPYWQNFGRWYHVMYPTDFQKYRNGLGQVAYDYPIMLVDEKSYWGVGNFNELTAVPSGNNSFSYLLQHEFGHFLGLNEEYDGGGRTELEFAPEIFEPWSQNMTFLRSPAQFKWQNLVLATTAIPTAKKFWNIGLMQGKRIYGAYRGGYAQSAVKGGHNHKPGMQCTMASGGGFCPICKNGIKEKLLFDLGLK